MKLQDFYFQDQALIGEHMAIPLQNGEDSGEWLNVVSPSADVSERAHRAFYAGYKAINEKFAPLKESGDDTEYVIAMNDAFSELNRQLALEIVNGWSFEEEFTKEALANLLYQYKPLANMIASFHAEQRKSQQEK